MTHRIYGTLKENSNDMPIVNLTTKDYKDMTKNLHRLMARALRRYHNADSLRKLRSK